MSNSAIDSDFIKFIVDLGTTGVKNLDRFIETFGMLGTTLTVGGIAAGIKNVGRPKMYGLTNYCFELPTTINVLTDTEVFLWSNVKYAG